MKTSQKDFAGAAPRAAKEANIFFFCGPDEAGASAAAARIHELLPDPGERVDMSGGDLRKDPVRLGDEARSSSLFGDTRHIYVRANGEEAHDAVKLLVDGVDQGLGAACPVLIVATSATDKSRTAKLLLKRKDALVGMFYPPELPAVAAQIRQMGDAAGVRLNGDLGERIARGAGLDVRLAQSEVTKLALYLDASVESPKPADAADLEAIGAATEEDGFMPLVNAVLSGETAKLPGELRRMREVSLNPVGLLLAFERRTAQLAQIAGKIRSERDISGVLQNEQQARRVFWKDRRDLDNQLRCWNSEAKLSRLVERLMQLHRALLSNNQSAEVLLSQGLAEIARAARVRR
ncbi:DNA-directed DNA polymerase [Alteripontixanthobacter maritimus]|uniref:DNA-directed DNA polymerase n=1 Tax=Alteripontixanthobacter maritimus TaxID=2161824 RepID=A0A369QAC2_9SPHN|nr:DNA polymerase III subunit delta [Alteripontixanthobacter maritimus]RDC61290.1 DNA-directed DNA polymerase [Alteripontixanthobacter maritimus]